MPTPDTIADLESRLARAQSDLGRVKSVASILGTVVLGGGILWLVWRAVKLGADRG